MKEIILLKIGGALITEKNRKVPTVNMKNLQRIAKEIKEGYNPDFYNLILVHGAGSFGHPIVEATQINKGIKTIDQVIAMAQTQKLQNELNIMVCEQLLAENLPAIPFQPSASAIMKNCKLISLNTDLIKKLLEKSLIPVLYGVPAYDEVQACSILSGDQIITHLAQKLRPKPKRVILATNVPGVLDDKGEVIKKIDKNNFDDIKLFLKASTTPDVTGGMLGKISELLQIEGVTSEIVGGEPGIIQRCLKGEKGLGTLIIA
ncbi:MAG: isopentenyl phosphate kinase [Candidatus Helarchaeota archaeon]